MVGIHQIQQNSVAKNILETEIPPKKGLSSWEAEARQKKADFTVTKKLSYVKLI